MKSSANKKEDYQSDNSSEEISKEDQIKAIIEKV
jgi:hypothetical protein